MPLDVTAVVSTTFVSTCLSHLNMYVRCTNCSRYIYILRIRIPIQHSTFNIRFRALRALLCLCHSHLLIRPAAFDFCVSCQMYLQLQHFIIINAREHVWSLCVSVYLYLYLMCAPANDSLKCLTIFCHIKFHFE